VDLAGALTRPSHPLGITAPRIVDVRGRQRAVGPGASFLLRGLTGDADFVVLEPPPAREEGAVLAALAKALGDDPRADAFRALSRGEGRSVPAGPALRLLAEDVGLWDPRSRAAFEAGFGEGIERYEAQAGEPAPWDAAEPLGVPLPPGSIAGIVWLPFPSLAEAAATWDLLARRAGGVLGRLLDLARSLGRWYDRPRQAERKPLVLHASLRSDKSSVVETSASSSTVLLVRGCRRRAWTRSRAPGARRRARPASSSEASARAILRDGAHRREHADG
jgi:hypothetical protein